MNKTVYYLTLDTWLCFFSVT